MIRFATLLLAGTLIAAPLLPADAATLKRDVTVEADMVLLGDLFDGLDADKAGRAVTTAPAPGRTLALDAPALSRIAASHGVDWQASGGADRTRIVRASHTIDAETIRDALRRELLAQGAPEGIEVTLDNRNLAVHLPAEAGQDFALESVSYDSTRNRVTAEIVAPATGSPLVRQSVGGRAVDMVEMPVLTRRIAPGEIISAADIAWVKLARDRMSTDMIADADALLGRTPRRAVATNQPLRERDVRAPIVVAKGSLVTILLQTASLTLSVQGRALEDGGMGEAIRIANTSSGRTVTASIAGPELVLVAPPQLGTPAAYTPATKGRTAQADMTDRPPT